MMKVKSRGEVPEVVDHEKKCKGVGVLKSFQKFKALTTDEPSTKTPIPLGTIETDRDSKDTEDDTVKKDTDTFHTSACKDTNVK